MQRLGPQGAGKRRTAVALAAMLFAFGSAHAGNGSFNVSVRVLAPQPAFDVLDAFPAPSGSMRLTRSRLADSYLCPMSRADAARALADAMRARGFELANASADDARQIWQDADSRIDVQLEPVLGATPATRIIVQADKRA
jgi:kynureninase